MPALVVEVVGDTSKLTKELGKAEAELKSFSRRSSSWDTRRAETGPLGGVLAETRALKESGQQMVDTFGDVDAAATTAGGSLGGMALKAGLAGLAVNVLGQNMSELGGNVGKVGAAFSDLSTGNIVGFVNNINSIDAASPEQVAVNVSKLAAAARKLSDPAVKAGSASVSLSLGLQRLNKEDPKVLAASMAKLGDTTKIAALQQRAAAEGFKNVEAAAKAASAQVNALHDSYVDLTKIHDPTSPGAIAAALPTAPREPPKPKPLTPEQRRAFFDARIAREIDRTQDIKTLQGQAAALRAIAAEIQNRIDATNDVTRKLNLDDQRVAVLRRAQDLVDRAASDAATAAAKAAREREQRLREAAAAAKAAVEAQRGWLDFALEKAEDTKTKTDNLKALRDIEAFIKERIRIEGRTLDNVRDLYRTRKQIRDLNKKEAADGDPLAGLMQVSSKRLTGILAAGTGLGAAGRRVLGANIAGAEIQPMYVSVQIDGREVGRAVTKDQARTGKRAPAQTSGRRG